MSSRRVPLVLMGLTALLLTACVPMPAASPMVSSTPTATVSERVAPELRTLDAVEIPGLHTLTDGDNGSFVYTVIPQVSGYERLNERLRDIVAHQREGIDGGAQTPQRGFVNVSWRTLGSSPDLVGFLVTSVVSPGASAAESEDSVWYDARTGELLDWRDLIAPDHRAEVVDDVLAQLRSDLPWADLAAAREVLESGDPLVGFTAAGALVLGFDEYEVADGASGMPRYEVDLPEGWLSERGLRARQATTEPTPLAAAPEPPPEEKPVDCRRERCVALTFDDGPSPRTTSRLLRILAEEKVPATFFVLGAQAQAHPSLLARISAEGHEIGNHSWSHPDLTRLSAKAARSQLVRTGRLIEKATGEAPTLMRPPYGARDRATDRIARDLGYAQVLWSIDTRDWQHHDPRKTVRAAAKAKRGAIVLMHDIHAETVDAVPKVISTLKRKGYTLVTVSDLLGSVKPGKRYYGTY